MTTSENLWGNLELDQNLRTPYTILQEQATNLTDLTNALLVGEITHIHRSFKQIEAEYPDLGETINYTFKIRVPILNNYTYSLLELEYSPTQLYPAFITDFSIRGTDRYITRNEQEFKEVLRNILSSERVHHLISVLLSQVQGESGKQARKNGVV